MVDLWMKNHQKSISHPLDHGFVYEKSSRINISSLGSWICG
jgi:hypothetical protein